FDKWAAVDCGGGNHPSIQFRKLNDVSCAKSEYRSDAPNVNVIFFEENGWTGGDIEHRLAGTKAHYSKDGEILDADIAINSTMRDFTVGDNNVKEDLVSVVTHEVGHFLGLDHSDQPEALMYSTYSTGAVRRDLAKDDIDAICTVY